MKRYAGKLWGKLDAGNIRLVWFWARTNGEKNEANQLDASFTLDLFAVM